MNPISQPLSQDDRSQHSKGGHFFGSSNHSQDYNFLEFNTQGSEYDYPEFSDSQASQNSQASQPVGTSWNTQSQSLASERDIRDREQRNGYERNRPQPQHSHNHAMPDMHDPHHPNLNFEEGFEEDMVDYSRREIDLPEHACK